MAIPAQRLRSDIILRYTILTLLLTTSHAGTVNSAQARLALTPSARGTKAIDGKIAFVSSRDGNLEIYSMNPDGSDQRNLTNSPGDDYTPAWTPDGRHIAFSSMRD